MDIWTHRDLDRWLRRTRKLCKFLDAAEVTDREVIDAIESVPTHFTDPTFRASKTQDLSAPVSITLAAPVGTLTSDVEVACISAGCTAANTPDIWAAPAGWTAVTGSPWLVTTTNAKTRMHLWTAQGTVSFAGTFTKSGGAGAQFTGVVNEAWSAVDYNAPIDVVAGAPSSGSAIAIATGLTVAAVTTRADRCVELIAVADSADGVISATGFTADENAHVNQVGCLLRATAVVTPAGSTGTKVVKDSAVSDIIATPFALRPAWFAALQVAARQAVKRAAYY